MELKVGEGSALQFYSHTNDLLPCVMNIRAAPNDFFFLSNNLTIIFLIRRLI